MTYSKYSASVLKVMRPGVVFKSEKLAKNFREVKAFGLVLRGERSDSMLARPQNEDAPGLLEWDVADV